MSVVHIVTDRQRKAQTYMLTGLCIEFLFYFENFTGTHLGNTKAQPATIYTVNCPTLKQCTLDLSCDHNTIFALKTEQQLYYIIRHSDL